MPVAWDRQLETSSAVIAIAPGIAVLMVRGTVTTHDAAVFNEALDTLFARSPTGLCVLMLFDTEASPPPRDTVRVMSTALTAVSDICRGFCAVVPGRGFKTSAIRTTLRMMVSNSGVQTEIKIGGETLSSFEWISERVRATGTMLSAGDLLELCAESGLAVF